MDLFISLTLNSMLVHNPSESNIKGFNRNGQVYNLLAGESAEFTDDVGAALFDTFHFLQVVDKASKFNEVGNQNVVEEDLDEAELVVKGNPVPEEVEPEGELPDDLPENYLQLKAYARDKGIDVTPKMTKEELLLALKQV